MKRSGIILLLLAFSVSLKAQQVRFDEGEDQISKKSYPVHVTDKLNNTEFFQNLAEKFPANTQERRKVSTDDVGDKRDFYVQNLLTEVYEQKEFQLIAKGDVSQIWFEVSEITNGHLNSSVADSMLSYLEDRSNQYSYDPEIGIVKLSNDVFGNPPNYDGDNYVDFLVTDIKDEWNPNDRGGYTAGFFFSGDQYTKAQLGGGNIETNERDILYIDSYPGIYDPDEGEADPLAPLSTLAHEYQHLIHFRYNKQNPEFTFINEGQSNFASLLVGYFPHYSVYNYLADTNIPIFRWDRANINNTLADYGRSASFMSFMWDYLGFEKAGNLTRTSTSGVSAINNALSASGSDMDFQELLVAWGIANLVNDPTNAFGYNHPFLRGLKVADIDYSSGAAFNGKTVGVKRGGISYIGLGQVGNLNATVSWSGSLGQARLVTVQGINKNIEVLENGQTFTAPSSESYDQAYIMLVNTEPSANEDSEVTTLTFNVSASGEAVFTLSKDSTYSNTPKFYWSIPYYNASQVGRLGFSNKFTAPKDALVHSVELFIVSGTDGSSGDPIQVKGSGTLHISVYDDDAGKPGSELGTTEIDFGDIGSGWQAFNIKDLDINVTSGQTFHVVYETEVATVDPDQNSIPLRLDDGTGDQGVTHIITGPNTFAPMFDDTDTQGQNGVWNRIVYGVALINSAEDDLASSPNRFVLDQNYPNPFNPSTTINFSLPEASEVTLKVFNTLGQEVSTLLNTRMNSGQHSVNWNAIGMSSGIYYYQLRAGDFFQTKQMMLLK